jgi:hypothetical protein
MDKYQELLMKRFSYDYGVHGRSQAEKKREYLSEPSIAIEQDEDITITKYDLRVECDVIETIFSVKDQEKTEEWKAEKNTFSCVLDFDDRVDGFRICFKDNIADDLFVKLAFHEADKEAYHAKQRELKRSERIEKASISHAMGINLINVYFQPCDQSFGRAELDVYLKKTHQHLMRTSPAEGCSFFVIKDLAPNQYEYVLKQYDKNGNLLFQTDNIDMGVADIVRTYSTNRTNSRF